jgi:hypothetical protein
MRRSLLTALSLLAAIAAALACAAGAGAWSLPALPDPETGSANQGVAYTESEAAPAAATDRGQHGGHKVSKPKISFDPISYSKSRKRQMANYSKRHYGQREWKLTDVRAIVLHYTAGSSYSSAWNLFNANTPSLGEKPGTCAQFIVDQDGTIYQLTRLSVRCRHTIGLNHVSLGIEMVQSDLGDPNATAKAILKRKKQANAAVHLAAWLKDRYGVKMSNVIGHGMANDSPLFKDKEGWVNDHVDWLPPQVRVFRERMNKLLH